MPEGLDDTTYLRWDRRTAACQRELTAYDTHTHKRRWHKEVSLTDAPDNTCDFDWIPELHDGFLLIFTPDGRPALVAIRTGETVWTGSKNLVVQGVDSDVLVVHDTRSDDIVAVDVKTSEQLWLSRKQAAEPEWWGAVDAGRLAFSIYHYADGETDRQLWIHNLSDERRSVCAGSNDVLGMGDDWLIGGLSGTGNDVDHNKIAFFKL